MSLADYPNQFTVFCNNSCTKLMADELIWRIMRWRINKNSLYTRICAVLEGLFFECHTSSVALYSSNRALLRKEVQWCDLKPTNWPTFMYLCTPHPYV